VKHTIKISGVIFGVVLAMTVAYAGTEDRSGQSSAPALTRNCEDIGGFCSTQSLCRGTGGVVINATSCTADELVCCVYP
jgi:hypothetical protein